MLSVGKIRAGQGGYYLEAVAQGREDYYTNSGEVPGRWLGRGAEALGLSGPVGDEAFVAVLAGVDPSGGGPLGRANRRVSAFDLTLSAPKSVSLLWALGPPGSASEVVAAHEAAVDAAVAWLERTAVRSRVGHNGAGEIVGEGLVAAAFRHRTSRAGHPQVHTTWWSRMPPATRTGFGALWMLAGSTPTPGRPDASIRPSCASN
jgi:conjugative relaxase-like TrwC/TraI family protein